MAFSPEKNESKPTIIFTRSFHVLFLVCDVSVFTLMKQKRMNFSNCFLDSSPTNAVTGMAASFYVRNRRNPCQIREGDGSFLS